jgi:hypothetical protein
MIFKIFSPKMSAKKMAFLTQNKAKICKILIITLVFEKNANFFRRKLAKIAENCDHNIDPWSPCRRGKLLTSIPRSAKSWIKTIIFSYITAYNGPLTSGTSQGWMGWQNVLFIEY